MIRSLIAVCAIASLSNALSLDKKKKGDTSTPSIPDGQMSREEFSQCMDDAGDNIEQ